jgi:hypothetical protein
MLAMTTRLGGPRAITSIKGALAVTAAMALLAGCGGDDKSDGGDFAKGKADDIVATAKADMKKLDSVHMSGSISSSGQSLDIDLQVSSEGSCHGTFGIGEGSAEVLGVDGKSWFKPNEAFWREQGGDQADTLIAMVGDKWVVDNSGQFSQFCDLDSLLDDVLADETTDATYSVDGTEEIDGDTVVKVDRKSEKDGTSSGYVLADSPHYLVKVEKTEGEDAGTITFAEFNEDFTVEAPADDEVIDLDNAG